MSSNSLRIFKKWNRIIHRDFGYFFFGLTLIYCISGIAVNHKKDWNPNYIISNVDIKLDETVSLPMVTEEWVLSFLKKQGEEDNFKKYYFPNKNTLKIFIQNGSVNIDMEHQTAYIEKLTKRSFFYEINFLHYNPGKWWTWYSDIFCVALILISISGLFIINKSKNSLTRRGVWFVIAGLLIPIIAMFIL
jgi:hypothetical protein